MSDNKTDIHSGHRARLKKRFLSEGLDSFEHHNVLELLLFYAIPRIDTNVVAHNLINEFGSISDVFDAPFEQLLKVSGVSENTATLISMVPQLSRVYLENVHKSDDFLDSSEKIGKFFVNKFIGHTQELVLLLCLDSSYGVIVVEEICKGTVSRANVSIRKVVDLVVRHNASAVVLAHNHPRGIAAASNEDIITTKYLLDALKLLDISLLDHIIVARGDYVSLSELGYIR